MSVNGQPVRGVRYRDTVPIPPMVDGQPGRVVIRQRYTDFTGRFVIHCHILFHEDHGMMAPVRVVRYPAGSFTAATRWWWRTRTTVRPAYTGMPGPPDGGTQNPEQK